MRQVIGLVGVTLLAAGPAFAADLAVKAPPMLAAAPGWTGFYLGGTLGGAWSDNPVDVLTTNTANNIHGDLSALGLTAGPASAVAATGSVGTKRSALTGGLEGGYNWQLAPNWVAGIEADFEVFSGDNGSGQLTQVAPRIGFPGHNFTATLSASDRVDWLSTVRARLGFLVTPTWLVYGTGGLAFGGASSSTSITGAESGIIPPDPFTPIAGAGAFSGTRVGWTAGAGMEYMFMPNWTVKAEWLHYDLGSVGYSNGTMNSFIGGNLEFTDVSRSTVKFTGDIVRAGVNYKF